MLIAAPVLTARCLEPNQGRVVPTIARMKGSASTDVTYNEENARRYFLRRHDGSLVSRPEHAAGLTGRMHVDDNVDPLLLVLEFVRWDPCMWIVRRTLHECTGAEEASERGSPRCP